MISLKWNIIRSDVAVRSISFIQNAPSTSGLAPLTLGSAGPAASSALGALKASPGMADIPVLWQLESMNISKYGDRQWNGMKWNVVEDWSGSHHLFYCLYPFSLNRVDKQDAPLDLSQETRSSEGRAGAWCGSCANQGGIFGGQKG